MRQVLNEIKANPSIILFIDEIHTIIGAGSAEGAVDAANIIKPALSRGQIRVIGATTISEYRKYIEKDAALERRFQPVSIEEPSEEQTRNILYGIKEKYEAHHGVRITDDAIGSAITLSKRYITDRFLPDKAIDLIDEACSKKRMGGSGKSPLIKQYEDEIRELQRKKEEAIIKESFELASELRDAEMSKKIALNKLKAEYYSVENGQLSVAEDDIRDAVSQWTNIPVSRLCEDEKNRLITLKDRLLQRIIGQEDAVNIAVNAIKRGRLGLKDPKRPISSFLFLGPTGVGKTALAKCICEELFPGKNNLIRLDMSEFSEAHSVSKLIGSPPGYVGYGEGGALTDEVRKKPYTVVLFDEIEKAHRDIYNLLLQILEDGSLTDAKGRRVDFKNCIIILTSNLGAELMTEQKRFGFYEKSDTEQNKGSVSQVKTKLKSHFSPEFLNRLDEIIVFNKLDRANAEEIITILLKDVKKLALASGISLSFGKEAISYLAEVGYDKVYGARPLRRTITTHIENPLSDMMLSGKISSGDRVIVSYDGAIKITKEK
jgi:ATP-dependent Clp protease ATP-binding subunit ClpC